MTVPLTPPAIDLLKSFDFSASFERGGKVFGYNYRLHAAFRGTPDEKTLSAVIEEAVIRKLHSHDLGLHVDFLKGVALEGPEILKALWDVIARVSAPTRLKTLTLQQDARTSWTLEASG